MSRTATLVVRFQFAAAHRLPEHDGPCATLHGHTWRGELTVVAPLDERTGMAMDFSDLKRVVDGVVPDHQYLNDVVPVVTCEALATTLLLAFQGDLPAGVVAKEITLWESDRCGVRLRVPQS